MKNLREVIQEKLKINSKTNIHIFVPETREELEQIIIKLIEQYGNKADLNDIDISKINDLNCLFSEYDKSGATKTNKLYMFNGNISEWDVSNVTDMSDMFYCSKFNGDISKWDVSNVTNMNSMFANSKFNGDISEWDVSNVKDMKHMFSTTKFNKDISNWDVSNVEEFSYMFECDEDFDQDLNKWNVNVKNNKFIDMFRMTKLSEMNKLPKWYK